MNNDSQVGMGRTLVTIGLILVAAGLAWPWLAKIPLGRLPGDIVIRRPGFSFFFPVTTSLLVSLVASLILWLLHK